METEKVKTKVSFVQVFTITLYAYLTVVLFTVILFAIFKDTIAKALYKAQMEPMMKLTEIPAIPQPTVWPSSPEQATPPVANQ